VSGIKLENLGNPQIMDIVGWNGNVRHSRNTSLVSLLLSSCCVSLSPSHNPVGAVTLSQLRCPVTAAVPPQFSHMSAEWIVNPPGNPSVPPFRVTQRGGGKVEMAFIGEAFDSFVPVFDVEPATRLYTVCVADTFKVMDAYFVSVRLIVDVHMLCVTVVHAGVGLQGQYHRFRLC
jgi:hypothetical protein